MKKVISLLLAFVMVASLSITAFATGETQKGSITINGASSENTYSIYKMMDLSYDETHDAYSYTVDKDGPWYAFFMKEEIKTYIKLDSGYVATWVGATDEATKAKFAKLALEYAQDKEKAGGIINPDKTTANKDDYSNVEGGIIFEGLDLGYYLIDSTMGALCGLTTTDFHAQINAKNAAPTIDKQVQEDSTNQYGDANTADIGQIVEYMTIINVHAGAQNYVLHDSMSEGLTFVQDLSNASALRGVWKIEHVVPGTGTHTVPTEKYEVKVNHTCSNEDAENCTFEVVFDQTFCDEMKKNDKIIVYYNAMLNRKALIADENINETWLDFGEDHSSNHDQTTTYTYGFDLVKTNDKNKLLDGAIFKIYSHPTLDEIIPEGSSTPVSTEVSVVIMEAVTTDDPEKALLYSNGEYVMFEGKMVEHISKYRRARPDEQGVEIIVNGGQVRIDGFDNGTYYLHEIKEPDGHNKLTARQAFTISDGNLDAIYSSDGIFSTGSGVHVVNNTGAMLPETGAAGTMLFITFGTFVVLGTGMLLVTKKRMSMIVE